MKSTSVYEPFRVLEISPPPNPSVPKEPRTTTYFDGQLLKAFPRPPSRMSKTSVSALSRPQDTPSSELGSFPKETNSDIHCWYLTFTDVFTTINWLRCHFCFSTYLLLLCSEFSTKIKSRTSKNTTWQKQSLTVFLRL